MLGILDEIQNMMAELRCEPEQFKGRIIFRSMYNDIILGTQGNNGNCMASSMNVAAYAKKFPRDVGHFWDLVVRKSGTELMSASQMVNGTKLLKS